MTDKEQYVDITKENLAKALKLTEQIEKHIEGISCKYDLKNNRILFTLNEINIFAYSFLEDSLTYFDTKYKGYIDEAVFRAGAFKIIHE